ncbi:hypothetical protein [Amycolatopsis sp. ATCC 39116]|nr:hypothetical protein [Amycolatopsis sp. ATCC 39116]
MPRRVSKLPEWLTQLLCRFGAQLLVEFFREHFPSWFPWLHL